MNPMSSAAMTYAGIIENSFFFDGNFPLVKCRVVAPQPKVATFEFHFLSVLSLIKILFMTHAE